ELYILGLSQNYFSIPLNGEKIFDKVQFTTTERVLRVHLKYIDVYGNEVLVQTDFESIGTLYTLNMNKIMTNSASIIMYGVLNIDNISINNYDRSNFYIDEDVDLRIPFQKIIGSTTNPNNSYPISNMFDGNWNSQFHCSQYGEHCDIYFKLDKEYLIDKLSLVSYRSNTSGLINKFKVLVKDTNNDNSWAELGGYTVDSYANKWLEVKNSTPYLTNEVCVRIEDSVNKWALICELELFIHSNLEKSINGLYLDDTFTSLRDDVSYEEILELEAKNLVTPDFIEKIAKAKELYIIKLPQNNFCLELSEERIFDKVQFITSERVLRAHIKYVDTYGVERLIESGFETLGNIYTLNINKIMTEDASLVLYGVSKIDEVSTNSFKKSEFYIEEDIDLRVTSDKIVVTTEKPNNSYPASNLFDGNLNSQFHCNQSGDYCDIFFKLDKPYLMDRLRLVSYRSNTSGLINEFKVLLKEMNTNQKWVELGEYKVESYQNKWLEVKGKPYLTDEICLRIEDSVNGWTLINELELFIHSDLEREIRDLFLDENCNILKDSVTYNEILVLENRVLITEEYRTLILRAKELYLDKQPDLNFILETDKKIVMNQIKVQTSGKVYKTEVVYNDEHNNEIRLQAKEIETREEEVVLTFPNFYCDRFNLMLDGDISEELIQNIKITQLNQNNFFEDKDIDVRLDKSQLTAVSNCGQFEDNSPDKVLDGNNETYFHSLTYSGSYGDFVIKLEQEYVVDRLRFITRGDNEGQGNGRIRAYEVLYKNSGSTEWKKVFEELSDQSGNDREAV
ncbi:MAG: discoidin domain-containing protein, partial [Cetobacterium sp.]